ncbi:MAG: hypothetical protein GX361_08265 [Bacteroidales bacterium]|nr:hypothetical protein [Bacteroidales bacterium]
MNRIKQYFSTWDLSRWLRLILGIIFGLAYAFEGQGFYLLLGVFFLVQAVMNIGCGCSTVNCVSDIKKDKETNFEFKKLNTTKKDV